MATTAMLEQHVTKASDGLVKESGVPTSDLPPVPGAMTGWLQSGV